MSELINELRKRGCDIDGTMGRFLDDEEFYGQCYAQVMVDDNYKRLKDALAQDNTVEAFEAAHSLKGVIANMGITPMYDVVVDIVEPLRAGNSAGLMPICDKLLAMREEYAALVTD